MLLGNRQRGSSAMLRHCRVNKCGVLIKTEQISIKVVCKLDGVAQVFFVAS